MACPFCRTTSIGERSAAPIALTTGAMRVILGNDVAVKAIEDHHINPWPDGTSIRQGYLVSEQPDGTAFVKTGAFKQVELMIRDSKKYGATKNWGWGRWLGTDLQALRQEPQTSRASASVAMSRCATTTMSTPFRSRENGKSNVESRPMKDRFRSLLDCLVALPRRLFEKPVPAVITRLNDSAALSGNLPVNPLALASDYLGNRPPGRDHVYRLRQ